VRERKVFSVDLLFLYHCVRLGLSFNDIILMSVVGKEKFRFGGNHTTMLLYFTSSNQKRVKKGNYLCC